MAAIIESIAGRLLLRETWMNDSVFRTSSVKFEAGARASVSTKYVKGPVEWEVGIVTTTGDADGIERGPGI